MVSAITFRPVRADECSDVVRLHRDVFHPSRVARTIYGTAHVDRYLANLIAFHNLQQEHVIWGAWDGQVLVGYAHCRGLPESWHLNNVAVLPSHQGLGIGRALWARFLEGGERAGYRRFSLDVEHDNVRALNWYQKQGFRATHRVWMYERDITATPLPPEDAGNARLLDWEKSEAWQAVYGFSEFRLACDGQVWTVGRLGKRYFRVSGRPPLLVERILAGIDPSRRLLIQTSEALLDERLEKSGSSIRMVHSLDEHHENG